MCCFAGASEVQVHGTAIFARLVAPGTQVLAYQMTYASKTPTAMILPLPVALPVREGSVRFKNLEAYPDFFEALARGFPTPQKWSWSKSGEVAASATLEVHDVGAFVASFVPRIADFARVDPRFVISPQVWTKLPAYVDYGFALFQLKELSGSPHPIALEFDSRLPEQLFFPTVHIHDGSVHAQDTFDHVLYAQASAFDGHVGSYDGPSHIDRHTGFVRSQAKTADFVDTARTQGLVAADLLLHKVSLQGLLPNRDTLFGVSAQSLVRKGREDAGACSRCAASTGKPSMPWPVEMTVAALGWSLLRRRHRRSETPRDD